MLALFPTPTVPTRINVRKAAVRLDFFDGSSVTLKLYGECFPRNGKLITRDAEFIVEETLEAGRDRGYLAWQGRAYAISTIRDTHVTYADHFVDSRGTFCA